MARPTRAPWRSGQQHTNSKQKVRCDQRGGGLAPCLQLVAGGRRGDCAKEQVPAALGGGRDSTSQDGFPAPPAAALAQKIRGGAGLVVYGPGCPWMATRSPGGPAAAARARPLGGARSAGPALQHRCPAPPTCTRRICDVGLAALALGDPVAVVTGKHGRARPAQRVRRGRGQHCCARPPRMTSGGLRRVSGRVGRHLWQHGSAQPPQARRLRCARGGRRVGG